jgi:hypothetical protein
MLSMTTGEHRQCSGAPTGHDCTSAAWVCHTRPPPCLLHAWLPVIAGMQPGPTLTPSTAPPHTTHHHQLPPPKVTNCLGICLASGASLSPSHSGGSCPHTRTALRVRTAAATACHNSPTSGPWQQCRHVQPRPRGAWRPVPVKLPAAYWPPAQCCWTAQQPPLLRIHTAETSSCAALRRLGLIKQLLCSLLHLPHSAIAWLCAC